MSGSCGRAPSWSSGFVSTRDAPTMTAGAWEGLERPTKKGFRECRRRWTESGVGRADAIPLVDEHDSRNEPVVYLGVLVLGVGHEDDDITRRAEPRARAVQLHDPGTGLAGNEIGLQPRAVVDVDDLHALVRQHVGRFHQRTVEREATLVVQVGPGERRAMDLGLAEDTAHGWKIAGEWMGGVSALVGEQR